MSQGWPSWAFALDGLGFSSILTSAYFPSLSSKEEFKSTSLGCSLINNASIEDWLDQKGDLGILFIQGDQSFLSDMYHRLDKFDDLRVVFGCSDPDFWTADGWRESHSACGGVTSGEWTFYCQNIVLSPDRLPSIDRSLRHVLRTTEGQSSASALSKAAGLLYGPNNRIAWNERLPKVRAHSVYHKDSLVDRLITEDELLDIYDLELEVQSDLNKYWKGSRSKSTRSYISQIPIKVLRSIGSRVITGLCLDLTPDTGVASDAPSADATLKMRNSSANGNSDSSLDSLSYDSDEQSVAAELRLGYDDDDASAMASDKAAKEDDAEAVSQDWDEWIVSNFHHPSIPQPLICTGSYSHESHQPFFDGLRKLLMRRYKRNFLHSFLRYMRGEYFVGKLCSINLHDLIRTRQYTTGKAINLNMSNLPKCFRVAKWATHRLPTSSRQRKAQTKVTVDQEMAKDLDIGRDAVSWAANSSWWSWDSGSTLFFWHWPRWSKSAVRDGIKLFVDWDLMPSFWKRQDWPDNPLAVAKLKKKL